MTSDTKMPSLFSRIFFLITLLFTCSYLIGCGQNSVNAPSPVASSTLSESISNGNTQLGTPQIISLLVPLQGPLSGVGQAVKQGFLAAAQANQNKPQIIVIDTTKEPSIQAAYDQALAQKAQLIVGPLLKPQVQTLAGLQLSTPVLALNYLNPDISTPPELFQFGLSPLDEARQAAQQAWKSGRRSALIMTLSDNWGTQIGQTFADEWKSLGGTIADRLTLAQSSSALTRQISHFLQFKPPHDRRTDFDVIFLASNPKVGRQVIPLLKFYYAGDIPVYATAAIYTGLPNRRLDNDLNQVIFCSAPWTLGQNTPNPALYEQLLISANSPGFFRRHRSYYALGVDAFHITQQLAYLNQSSAQTLPGTTGQLTLNEQRRIVRQLTCAQFIKGHVRLIN